MALIKCPECGGRVSNYADSCPHCGHKMNVSTVENHENIEEDNIAHNYLNCPQASQYNRSDFQRDIALDDQRVRKLIKKSNPKKKRKTKLIITISLAVILAIFLFIRNIMILNEANILYAQEKYSSAYFRVNDTILCENCGTYQKILFSFRIGLDYDMYQDYLYPSYGTPDNEDYRRALKYLLDGVEACNDPENIAYANENGLSDKLETVQQRYYNGLLWDFGIDYTKANELADLDRDLRDAEVQEIANKKYEENKEAEERAKELERMPIEFYDLEWDNNSVNTVAVGSVKNISNFTVKFVEIKVAFKDEDGNVIDTGWTYAVGLEGLYPGESCKWSVFVDRDYNIKTYSVYLLDYQ